MGDGSYGGNGSVYWKVSHKTNGGGPQKLKNLKAAGTNQKTDHWIDIHENTASFTITGDDIEGHDPKPLANKDSFSVTVTYRTTSITTSADLMKALAELIAKASGALANIAGGKTDETFTFKVPIVNRTDPPTGNDYEVQVKW